MRENKKGIGYPGFPGRFRKHAGKQRIRADWKT
jgi:hypothetical protein